MRRFSSAFLFVGMSLVATASCATRAAATDAEIKACEAAMDAPNKDRATFARACARLYRRKPCANAFEKLGSGGVLMDEIIACRDAYCPDLDSPKPALCSREKKTLDLTQLPPMFNELNSAILRHDNGARADGVIQRFEASGP